MDLQPSQNSHDEEDRLQTSESLSGFFSRMTVSNKTMERIMRQDSNLSPYDGFRIGGIGKVLNQIGLNQRKHHIIYKVSSGEFAIPIEFTGNVMEMQLIPKEEILEELSRLREEVAVTMKWIHIGTIEVEFAKVMAPDPIRIPRIGGVDIIIKDHPVLDRTMSSRIEYGSRMSFSEDRITGYKGKEKDLARVLTPQEIRQPVIGRYEGMLEIAGHEFLVAGVAGRENGDQGFAQQNLEFSLKKQGKLTCYCRKGFFTKNPNTQYRDQRSKIMIGGALERPGSGIKGNLEKFSCLSGNRDSSIAIAFTRNLRKKSRKGSPGRAKKTMDISEESILSLENVKRLIQRNFSENPLAWWDRNKIEATLKIKKSANTRILIDEAGIELQEHIVEKIRNFPDKGFSTTLKETESAKWKWEEIHTQRVRELKQVCNNLPKLAIPQDEDELVVYTDANDYRWAAVLMKKTTTGEEPCRYTGGLFTEQQAQVWHINEKEFFAVWKAFKKWPLFLLAKEFTLKVDNTNVKAFLKNKLESKIEKARIIRWQAECQYYCYNIVVIKSHENVLADFLTRDEGAEANSVMLRLRHLRENLEELDREFGRLAVNAQVAGQVQRADLDKVQTNIRSSLVASTALWNALLEPIRKASPSVMTRELREQGSKPALRVQGSRPVAADSSTACTRPSSDSGETATDESQGVKTSDDSSQPSTSGVKEGEISLRPMTGISKTNTNELSSSSSSAWQVYQRMWEKLISRKGVNPSKTIIETTGKYNRVWMMEGSKPEEVREWYEFGALASVHTMPPSFPEISKLPEWISGAVYDSWQNNPHLKRGDILELKFISAAPEMAGKGSHPAFHFIKLQRSDMVAFNRIKATTEEAPLVSAISEDDISTRRAWGLWVCLTEMDKVKYPFKIFSNKVNGSFLLNSMTGKSTEFAESMFEKKRMLIWENKLPATESTRMKACNMLHVGQWHNHVCPCCKNRKNHCSAQRYG
ncbi:hypothetical protein Sango_2898200 [Sesamum angolense]|uniref:Reverse transcriptase RNase H-like domain-containing protein n=1 Tax=Sesamum angolense TaxID=2727404 RepID=A0AAE1T653_9LAMI|nr:hypothetical protein Sango_2898200 [Sesamum angolense]